MNVLNILNRSGMGNLYALVAAFRQQSKSVLSPFSLVNSMLNNVPTATMVTWIASRKEDPVIFTYVAMGLILLSAWNTGVFRVGQSLGGERFGGTLEPNLVTKTSLAIVMTGKALATYLPGLLSGAVAFFIAVLMAGHLLVLNNPLWFATSLCIAYISMLAVSVLFMPLMVLVRGQGGFFNAITAFGIVFSGFVFPVTHLPFGMEYVGRALPSSWAMEAMVESIEETPDISYVAIRWAIIVGISLGYVLLTYWLFKAVERRLRVTGTLTTS